MLRLEILDHPYHHYIDTSYSSDRCYNQKRTSQRDHYQVPRVDKREPSHRSSHSFMCLHCCCDFSYSRLSSHDWRRRRSSVSIQEDLVGDTCRNSCALDWCMDWFKHCFSEWTIPVQRLSYKGSKHRKVLQLNQR